MLELRLLRRLLSEGGTLVVAGDESNARTWARGVPVVRRHARGLGAPNAERVHLETSYRCPPELTDVVRELRTTPSRARPDASSTSSSRMRSPMLHVVMDLAASIRSNPRTRRPCHGGDCGAHRFDSAQDCRPARRGAFRSAGPRREVRLPTRAARHDRLGRARPRVRLRVLARRGRGDGPIPRTSLRRALYLALTRTCAAVSVAWV